ncbi:MAG: hydrogenase maturation protease [Fervidicoccaceae archaeon]
MRVLIAGVGNELRRDDGLGSAVVRAPAERRLPDDVEVLDADTNLYDVFLKILGGSYGAVIFVDAVTPARSPAR